MFDQPTRIMTCFLVHGLSLEAPEGLEHNDVLAIGMIDNHTAPEGQFVTNPHAKADEYRQKGHYVFSRNLIMGGDVTILFIVSDVPNLELDARWELWVAMAIDIAYFTYFMSVQG